MNAEYAGNAAAYFHLPEARILRSTSLHNADITITRLTATKNTVNLTDPIPPANAFVLSLQLQPLPRHELWLDGKREPVTPYGRGAISVVDLAARPTAFLPTAFDCIQFYLPQATLEQLAAAEDRAPIRELAVPHGAHDPFVESIGKLLLPALSEAQAPRLFVDGLIVALHHHLAARYMGARVREPQSPGRLAAWQVERVKAMIDAHLDESLSMPQLAAACELSPSYFCRAFRLTTGIAPYQWLLRRRMEKAQEMLAKTDTPIAEIAFRCGFSDQSHFTRTFSRMTGVPPGAWRRPR